MDRPQQHDAANVFSSVHQARVRPGGDCARVAVSGVGDDEGFQGASTVGHLRHVAQETVNGRAELLWYRWVEGAGDGGWTDG